MLPSSFRLLRKTVIQYKPCFYYGAMLKVHKIPLCLLCNMHNRHSKEGDDNDENPENLSL
ncbi:hypothetical protein TREPR_1585 [Treponema primitia ZAS-2]|uniref:Uncharacterized protein n=1 Tax=Treponema primitia (strain ATCC BAA-887 / DSM 12427 / ZAS-2) TaxID=545694 RepID=F5YNV1_TREPZ|nr:hypothetical protein TREPR_1585 [Treponema primitia ZAS-2]